MSKKNLTKEEIKIKYKDLVEGENMTSQQRGFEFEKLIFSMLQNENLDPRASYKPDGEQVDGSFFWQGQTFLLEAKWVKDPLPASSIYAFKGKLDGKFHTSSGIFISVNGYNDDVEDALKFGKSLNILLFDENDIPMIFNGEVTFLDVLKFKLREAGDTGSLKVSYKLKKEVQEISKTPPEIISREAWLKHMDVKFIPQKILLVDDLLVFVEGKTDIPIVKNLLDPIKELYSLSYKIESLNGSRNIRQLPSILSLYGDYGKTKAVIVVLDNDQEGKNTEIIIKNVEEQLEKSSIYVNPLFLFIDSNLKGKLLYNKLAIDDLRNELAFEKLETFIRQIAQDYYDPILAAPKEALQDIMINLEWDFENKIIEGREDYAGDSFSIDSLEGLIEYLNEQMIQAIHAVMPWDWLKEQDEFDYEYEIREYLLENNSEEIKKMGWDINDL